jgi:hypothetical protein
MPLSISEDRYYAPVIETGRVINVNMTDWSVDVVSEHANKLFFDIQVMSPYFHYFNGEGIYCMPEVGATCWVCKPSNGRMSDAFVMGFMAPFDQDHISYRCNRQNLNPGDIMLRTRDENFVILRRGGVVQIGAGPICQRMYIPIRNFIKDFCENYQLTTLGGDLTWEVKRPDQTPDGTSPCLVTLNSREFANTPNPIATLSIGSHGPNDPTILDLVINDSGQPGAVQQVHLAVSKAGDVIWELLGGWSLTTVKDITMSSSSGKVLIESQASDMTLNAGNNWLAAAKAEAKIQSATAVVEATQSCTINSPDVELGGTGGDPIVKFPSLSQALTDLATAVDTLVPGTLSKVTASLATMPSTTTKAK